MTISSGHESYCETVRMDPASIEAESLADFNRPQQSKLHFDDVLAAVGSFGRYQKLIAFFVILPAIIPSGFLDWALVFLSDTPTSYMCSIPTVNMTDSHLEEAFLQSVSGRALTTREKCCAREPFNQSNIQLSCRSNESWNGSKNLACEDGWIYDRSEYEETAVTEWNLVCHRKHLRSTARTVSAVGGLFGPMVWSFLADRVGRKKGFFLCIAFQSVFSILTGVAPSFVWFCVFRFCTGMTTSASYTIPYDLLLEISGPKSRGFLSILSSVFWTVGCLIFVLIAYHIRNWRELAFASAIPAAVLYLVLFWFFPESPRWLLSQGSYSQLESYLRHVAHVNRRPLSEKFQAALPQLLRQIGSNQHSSSTTTQKRSFLDLLSFRHPNMLKRTLILVFLNICNKGVSRGLNQYAPTLHENPYFSVLLTVLIGFPAFVIAKPAYDYLGRRVVLIVPLLVGSVACMTTAIQSSLPNLILGLSLVAKFAINFSYLTGKLVEGEIFPTVVRSEGHSLVSILSAVAVIPVPFIVDIGLEYRVVPLMVFGGACFIATFLIFFLPETKGARLPQTMEEGEAFGKDVEWRDRFRLFRCDREAVKT